MRLREMLGLLSKPTRDELLIASPYLIPVGSFLENIRRLESSGIAVRILTASMASNNHTIAHSHYKKYRRPLLETGAELYEFRADPAGAVRASADTEPVQARFISLHVKALVSDRKRCFIGSLNLDPRALELNTENGLYIESPGLAAELASEIDRLRAPENAWAVELDARRRLTWSSSSGIVDRQPARGFGQRVADFFFALLPIESQL
jgi:putative cardiolipin synthase